ncbi:hypothetical protein SAMN05421823_102206 [Catalinimonas alkaloidigena]|uniref:Uncharacterized protein n=1 Tax=Catalinimonas alkaloidigena TaxID=1075417 RepID=A0A1G9A9W4_9BACT|nr:hypothetical protein SAMN05421823_102206 [Catalinimonas alkaloidigena]
MHTRRSNRAGQSEKWSSPFNAPRKRYGVQTYHFYRDITQVKVVRLFFAGRR